MLTLSRPRRRRRTSFIRRHWVLHEHEGDLQHLLLERLGLGITDPLTQAASLQRAVFLYIMPLSLAFFSDSTKSLKLLTFPMT